MNLFGQLDPTKFRLDQACIMFSCLKKKKTDLQEYLNSMVKDSFVIDEISLTLIAQIYNIHIAVIFQKDFVWSTQIINDLSTCEIVLAYMWVK